jgi:predicted 3-demethylubiquinone-9 3-methyltransferase (glyoxalase superfamily)
MHKIHPFLWFESGAEDAAKLYVSVFDGKILNEHRWGPGGPVPEGTLMSVQFEIDGREYEAFNGGPHEAFNDSISLWASVDTQEEIDRIWEALTANGGEGIACGWLRDPFGVRWQIIPPVLGELMSDPDPERAGRATQAMMKMVKLDIAALRAAADG